jgi:signal transduction histidine kinase
MGEVRGALLLEQAGDALPLLTNRALLLLIGASLFALLLAGGILFAFASALGLRIRRLRNAAERALRAGGQVDTAVLPLIGARDELGDLARSFARLLDEVNAYTDYLRTLASKLSHELQTPLAIVKSSLDNLDHQAMPAEAHTYLARARDGAERLGAIVRAMSEASRMERAIAGVEGEDFDLAAVLRGCVEAYGALAAPRRVDGDIAAAPVIMHGAPELVAQALDKLFDNARSFTPDDGWIRLSLRASADGAEIRVANSGPLLPPAMQERLFDSLVSVRPSAPARTRRGTRRRAASRSRPLRRAHDRRPASRRGACAQPERRQRRRIHDRAARHAAQAACGHRLIYRHGWRVCRNAGAISGDRHGWRVCRKCRSNFRRSPWMAASLGHPSEGSLSAILAFGTPRAPARRTRASAHRVCRKCRSNFRLQMFTRVSVAGATLPQ